MFEIENEDMKMFGLYRYDGFGEAAFGVKENKTFFKNNISNGDTIALRNTKNLGTDEKFKFTVHITTTGLPDDCIYLGEIYESKESKIIDLKETILAMPHFNKNEILIECIRLREKMNN
jgi:hypothetical protein